jgi:hypothetical protein
MPPNNLAAPPAASPQAQHSTRRRVARFSLMASAVLALVGAVIVRVFGDHTAPHDDPPVADIEEFAVLWSGWRP